MWKRVALVLFLAVVGYVGYDYYRLGYHSAPETGEGDFLVSFEGGFRGVMRGIEYERQSRRYLGYPNKNTPTVYEESWSTCRKPSEEEAQGFANREARLPGERLDAVCEIDADGDVFVRGWVASIPDV